MSIEGWRDNQKDPVVLMWAVRYHVTENRAFYSQVVECAVRIDEHE
jgi:hypothetical protein